MLDHVSLKVADYDRAEAFYDIALSPLGLRRLMGAAAGRETPTSPSWPRAGPWWTPSTRPPSAPGQG